MISSQKKFSDHLAIENKGKVLNNPKEKIPRFSDESDSEVLEEDESVSDIDSKPNDP